MSDQNISHDEPGPIGGREKRPLVFLLAEFVVLVVGVFLGVQVDRWYEDHKEALEDQNYLHRLDNDIAVMSADYDELMEGLSLMYDQSIAARKAMESCDLSVTHRDVLNSVLSSHQVLLSYPVSRSTYDEMIAYGAFARIDNVELKNEVANLYRIIELNQDSLSYLRQDLGRASEILLRRFPFTNDADGQLMVANFDFDAVCQDVEIQSGFAEVVDSRADWGLTGKVIRAKLEQVADLLARELAGS